MQRRGFLLNSMAAAALVAVPPAIAASVRGPLLDDPLAWLGTRFATTGGATLELVAVEQLELDPRSTQCRLQFRNLTGAAPAEGIHRLSGAGEEQSLFLQAGSKGPVACLNRLRVQA
jgi:hypothetical protein